MTFKYSIGITNLEFVISLGDDTDSEGNIRSKCMVPYSFRAEEIKNTKFNNLYDVTHVLRKKTGERKYSELTFGDVEYIKYLPTEMQQKIELK